MRGELRRLEPMRKHVSWRAGGLADQAYVPADLQDLVEFIRARPQHEALLFVGLGSNLLVRDAGFEGTVILMHAVLNEVRLEADRIYADAGVASPKLARFAAKHGFEGAEFLAGIPGTVGGALAMNAGCYGTETWTSVQTVMTLNRSGEVRKRPASDYDIGYRHIGLRAAAEMSEEYFVGAWFQFKPGDGAAAQRRIKELLQHRIRTQPLQQANAGSVFRNPPNDFAARLIEQCGLKGRRLGGAQVSEKHANFIVNVGGASASDIEALIITVQNEVARQTGIRLEREVRIVGRGAMAPEAMS